MANTKKRPSELLQQAIDRGINQAYETIQFVLSETEMDATAALYYMITGEIPWHWNDMHLEDTDPFFREHELRALGVDVSATVIDPIDRDYDPLFACIASLGERGFTYEQIIPVLQEAKQ